MTIESQTFSALVDDVIAISLRRDRQTDIYRYLWQTIRECQVMAFFANDRVEDQVTATTSPATWEVPLQFRMMETVRYPYTDQQGNYIFPKYRTPGQLQSQEDYWYYRAGTYFAFGGIEEAAVIDIAYFVFAKQLIYYAAAARPATFDIETQTWSYLTASTDADKLIARELVTNWLIFNWYPTMLEGVLAKLYKAVGDERAGLSYSLFKSGQKDILSGEPYESLNR